MIKRKIEIILTVNKIHNYFIKLRYEILHFTIFNLII